VLTEHSFSLVPFPNSKIPDIQITGKISRTQNFLNIHYSLTGDIGSILIPEVAPKPLRKNKLWQETCFEFFVAIPEQSHYWEFNLSPSGAWNVFRMDAYRRIGLREETAIPAVLFLIQTETGRLSADTKVGLSSIIAKEDSIQVGITSVIEATDGHQTYWALAHLASQPDFHIRESFILLLD
jgi:hypothetical protein